MTSAAGPALRILHVIPWRASRYGGPTSAVDGMCQYLTQRGIDVIIASTDADGGHHLDVKLGTVIDYHGVPSIFFRRQWHDSFQFSHGFAKWVSHQVAAFDFVHIHGVFSHPCIAAAQACQRARVPYAVRPFGSLDPWSMRRSRFRKRLFWYLVVRRMLQKAAVVHYTTDEERRLAETSLGLASGVVIPLGVDLGECERAQPGLFRSKFGIQDEIEYIITLSRIHPKKGLDILIQSFADIDAGETRKPLLVIAGDGDPTYLENLRMLAVRRGVSDCVLFTGWLSGPIKFSAFRGALAFALFSHQENFGISVAEALACGTPVAISSNVNLAPMVEEVGVGWVAPLEPAAIRSTLLEVLNPSVRGRRAARARELARARFSWTTNVDRLITVYESVIAAERIGSDD